MSLVTKWAATGAAILAVAFVLTVTVYFDELTQMFADTGGDRKPPPPLVELAYVEPETITSEIITTGTLESPDEVTVTAELAGRVESIRFAEGQPVSAGDTLVDLERTREAARVEEAEARVMEAERTLARRRELQADELASVSQVDAAIAALATARAALQIARENLDAMSIKAPFDGIAGRRLVSPGALIEPGAPVTFLVVIDPLEIVLDVPATELASLQPGMMVRARTPAYPGESFEAEITYVAPEVDTSTRSLTLEARLDNPEARLKPGMFVEVTLVSGTREALTAPEEALLARGPAWFVFVVDDAMRADRVQVRTGVRRDGWVEITEGLKPGVRIVVSGLQHVRDGQPVRTGDREHGSKAAGAGRDTP